MNIRSQKLVKWKVKAKITMNSYGKNIKKRSETFFPLFSTPTILVIIFLNFPTFKYRFDSPQVNRSLISRIKVFVQEWPQYSSSNLRFRILGNKKISGKSKLAGDIGPAPSLPSRSKTLVNMVKKYAKVDFKVFWCSLILLDCLNLFQIFWLALYYK